MIIILLILSGLILAVASIDERTNRDLNLYYRSEFPKGYR